ncbi:uncharacterized protein LOC132726528 [Ruditapes philippinarum]|uniref:uncharacterized protein LOC132726528 n=1 Tax=Ruditapes philippinarum TaxID=129788 RepID=UPI00295BFEC6|nr:uncharacterized protein LOC132726528 [Ruditapes philippinarum]
MDFNIKLVVLLFVCFQAIHSSEGKKKPATLNVLTFNVALHESEQFAIGTREPRKRKIIRALKKSDADLICLQEVFIGEDVEAIVNNLKEQFPYSYSEMHTAVNKLPPQAKKKTSPPCDYANLSAYIACVKNSTCYPLNISCITTTCTPEVENLFRFEDQGCFTCIAESMWNVEACGAEKPIIGGRQVNNGGLILLSKKKLYRTSFKDYHPTTRESYFRGYIKTKIRNFADVRCTHLKSTNFPYFFEPELQAIGFNSLEEVHTHQTKALIKSLKKKRPAIILGDINTGLAFKPKLMARIPENYIALLKQFTTRPANRYTYKDWTDESNKSITDHVFVRDLIIRKTKRLYIPKDGKLQMSDHVGVQSVVKRAC